MIIVHVCVVPPEASGWFTWCQTVKGMAPSVTWASYWMPPPKAAGFFSSVATSLVVIHMVVFRACIGSAVSSTEKSTVSDSSASIRRGSAAVVEAPPSQAFQPKTTSGAAYDEYGLYVGQDQVQPNCSRVPIERRRRHCVCG